jgi:hypothetical protein
MITLKEIEEEIGQAQKELSAPQEGDTTFEKWQKHKKKAAKKFNELMSLKLFLKQNPKPEDLKAHLTTLEKQREFINNESNFKTWIWNNPGSSNDLKKAKTSYQKEMGLAHINSQIKTLKYLLR